MGRKQFRQDLAAAKENPPAYIEDVYPTEDGEISFDYVYISHNGAHRAPLKLLAMNVDDYPHDNSYIVFANDGEVAASITRHFDVINPLISNRTIYNALSEISSCLHQTITSGWSTNPVVLNSASEDESATSLPMRPAQQVKQAYDADDSEEELESVSDDDNDDNDECFDFGDNKKTAAPQLATSAYRSMPVGSLSKTKMDLREAKRAGFKIGIIGDLTAAGIVCISLRISKMGISEDVMKAWSLQPQQYFVVLIRCLQGYATLENIMGATNLDGVNQVRVGLCSNYKPNNTSAFEAFSDLDSQKQQSSQHANSTSSRDDFLPMFISLSLNDLFKARFSSVTRYRDAYSLGWAGAEKLAFDTQGAGPDPNTIGTYSAMLDNDGTRAFPSIVVADSMSTRRADQCSMPLVAMEFALRHFVRCTEFCLVCHCSSGSTFEALKPYVCNRELCLYQYLSLGFGPNLLISFCYAQARANKLKDFPDGIHLTVPILPQYSAVTVLEPIYGRTSDNAFVHPGGVSPSPTPSFTIQYNSAKKELLFADTKTAESHRLKQGDFVALIGSDSTDVVYHCVASMLGLSVKLGAPVSTQTKEHRKPEVDKFVNTACYLFDNDFDSLSKQYKNKAIMAMLDTLPSVTEMVAYLTTHGIGHDASLRLWRERISGSALNVLRWIIASNRSCILQVDTLVEDKQLAKQTLSLDDRVTGMDAYMQFRFASGAPDKEQKFIDNVNTEAAGKPIPTLFAWHGSPLENWHSIIREGLRFDDIAHGRAFGNGVYMSPFASTSVGYMGSRYNGGSRGWLNSELNIQGAMSLNEVVNMPESYVSQNPHYVVANISWIQTRYLFVQTSTAHSTKCRPDAEYIVQDPTRLLRGSDSTSVVGVPLVAISESRRRHKQGIQETKKRKSLGSGKVDDPFTLEDDASSVVTDLADRGFLVDDESHTGNTPIQLDSDTDMADYSEVDFSESEAPKKRARQEEPKVTAHLIDGCLLDSDKTDFFPGSTDLSGIMTLPPPDDATTMATNLLAKSFRDMVRLQSRSLAHELGWYINPVVGANLYQWIVELHSFDKDSPIGQDMKKAKVTSIVLELRFMNDFPHSPPFVRVVKPRFLPFRQGGGGHVTEGGAICMELLTNKGWTAASSMESVLFQVKLNMSIGEPPGRLLNT